VRSFDESLFLEEEVFDLDPQYRGVNPRPRRNLLERFDEDLAFVEQPVPRRVLGLLLKLQKASAS
jgi:hypothetical protein